jgi:hypothetical protein
MILEPIVEPSRPAWRTQMDRHSKPANAVAPMACFNQPDDDIAPDPPPAAPAARPWPRVIPGL